MKAQIKNLKKEEGSGGAGPALQGRARNLPFDARELGLQGVVRARVQPLLGLRVQEGGPEGGEGAHRGEEGLRCAGGTYRALRRMLEDKRYERSLGEVRVLVADS